LGKKITSVILPFIIGVFQVTAFAGQKPNLEDACIGLSIKTFARAYVALEDIDALKLRSIAKLKKLSEEKFQARYAKVYDILKDLPEHLLKELGILEYMTKTQAMEMIKLVDKKKIYFVIDAIPDAILAREFHKYVFLNQPQMKNKNPLEQLRLFWDKITQGA
jgi:hypothetical protein